MTRFIAIMIFIGAELVFDSFAPSKSTNWSIAYFSMTWLTIMLVSLDSIRDYYSESKLLVAGFSIFVIISGYFITVELLKINMLYDDYIISVNTSITDKHAYLFLTVSLLLLAADYWVKYLKYRKQCQSRGLKN